MLDLADALQNGKNLCHGGVVVDLPQCDHRAAFDCHLVGPLLFLYACEGWLTDAGASRFDFHSHPANNF
jgi:hypothetical protein